MLKHTVAGFTIAVAAILLSNSSTPAQPGPGKDGVKKLEADLEKLRDQVKEAEAKLAKAKEGFSRKPGFENKSPFGRDFKGKPGFEGKGPPDFKGKGGFPFGKGGFGPKGFEGKKKEDMKKEAGKGGPGSKLDPATIKEKYEFYKKLYDELPKESTRGKGGFEYRGKGSFGKRPESNSVEARLDRLAKELESLRKELKNR